MKKTKYNRFITESEVDGILQQKYKDHNCPSCGSNGIYAGCIETEYDEQHDENVMLSFDVFCKDCGACLEKWDNTNREYFLGKRQ